jgi:hypothetical protein
MAKKRRYMNRITDQFLDLIYQEEAYLASMDAFTSIAECDDNPYESFKNLLERWAKDIVFVGESRLAIFVRESLVSSLDFDSLTLYFLSLEDETNE